MILKFRHVKMNHSCIKHLSASISNGSNEDGSDHFLQPLLFQPRTVFTDGGGKSTTSWKWTSCAHHGTPRPLALLCFTDSVIRREYKNLEDEGETDR